MDDLDLPLNLSDTGKGKGTATGKGARSADEEATPQEIEEAKLPAILGYVPFLFFVPLLGAKNNRFAVQHGRQAFVLFLIEIIALLFLIDVVSAFFWTVVFVACIGLALVACVNAAQGRFWKIPILSDLMKKYDLFGGN